MNGPQTRRWLTMLGGAMALCAGMRAQAQDWPQYAAGPERCSASGSNSVPRVGALRWSLTEHAGQAVAFSNPGGVVVEAGGV